MQKEILLVYSFIETIGSLVSLKAEPMQGQQRQCIILTDEDKSPHYVEANAKTDSAFCIWIFTKLFKAFEAEREVD